MELKIQTKYKFKLVPTVLNNLNNIVLFNIYDYISYGLVFNFIKMISLLIISPCNVNYTTYDEKYNTICFSYLYLCIFTGVCTLNVTGVGLTCNRLRVYSSEDQGEVQFSIRVVLLNSKFPMFSIFYLFLK